MKPLRMMSKIVKQNIFSWDREQCPEMRCLRELDNPGEKCGPPVYEYAHDVKGPWCQECHDHMIFIIDWDNDDGTFREEWRDKTLPDYDIVKKEVKRYFTSNAWRGWY